MISVKKERLTIKQISYRKILFCPAQEGQREKNRRRRRLFPDKRMATVYLHIGTMKTGTSALQRFLSDNREYLKQQGVLYPDLNQGMPERFRFRNGHFLVYEAGSNKEYTGR